MNHFKLIMQPISCSLNVNQILILLTHFKWLFMLVQLHKKHTTKKSKLYARITGLFMFMEVAKQNQKLHTN